MLEIEDWSSDGDDAKMFVEIWCVGHVATRRYNGEAVWMGVYRTTDWKALGERLKNAHIWSQFRRTVPR